MDKQFLCDKCGYYEFYASERSSWGCEVNEHGTLICTKPAYCGDFEVECAKCGEEIKVDKFNGVEFE